VDTTLADPLVGRVLDRRYRIEARLAGGGMGTVYTATDTRLDRTVAVKVMQPGYAADPAFVSRFISEARAAARLSHPNVVAVFDQGSEPAARRGSPVVFLVMEYVPGVTLRRLLADRGRLPAGDALAVLEPVLGALGAAHAAGLVHRDVKPENVLLAADGRVKVADFGLARAVAATAATGSVTMLIGTVAYLAPEQVTTGAADARTDVYAAGILLYELLTGSPPFDGAHAMAVAFRHVHEDVPRPSATVRGLPGSVDDLVRQATARDPAHRFADAAAFLSAVRKTAAQLPNAAKPAPPRPVPITPPPPGTRPTRVVVPDLPAAVERPPGRRRGGRIGLLAVLALTVLAGVTGWWLALGRYATAPSLLATSKPAANSALSGSGLRAHWLPDRFDASVPAGRVAYEDPAPGERVRHGGTVALALSKGPEVHRVPVLMGTPLARAQQTLAAIRLRAVVSRVYSDTVRGGSVVATKPKAGTLLHPGDLVALTLSKGRRPVTVPDVRSQPVAEAQGRLSELGFTTTRTEDFSDTVPAGNVIGSTPSAGDTAPHGTAIALVISKGPQLFPVPDVRRLSAGDATSALRAAGFKVRTFELFGFGLVHVVSPKVGTMVAHGTTVSIIVY
jgi:eukaryotic-like serine/threonine-protein kinase